MHEIINKIFRCVNNCVMGLTVINTYGFSLGSDPLQFNSHRPEVANRPKSVKWLNMNVYFTREINIEACKLRVSLQGNLFPLCSRFLHRP